MGCLRLTDEKTRHPLKVVYNRADNFLFLGQEKKQTTSNFCVRKYQYKYSGKEFQDELGLNMYDMDMRQYDPAIARWVVLDPVIHHSMSPYNAFDNNPVFWADPSGADAVVSAFPDRNLENFGTTDTMEIAQIQSDQKTMDTVSSGLKDFQLGKGDYEGYGNKNPSQRSATENGDPTNQNNETNNVEQNCCPDGKPKIEVKLDMTSDSTKSIKYAFVQNDFKETVYYKPEVGSEKEFIRTNGTIHEKVDGIRVGDTVIKVSDGYRSIIVDKNGNVNITYSDPIYYGIYLFRGGELKSSPGSNWDALFDKK